MLDAIEKSVSFVDCDKDILPVFNNEKTTGTENDEQRSVGKRIKIYLLGVFNNRRKTENRSRGSRREGFKAIDGGTE